ncbi:MAG: D-lysine 5,6-aminomutase subunit alpha [Myxococcales bacterium]|nr:D-lysine 5,6-aminomutase subunit alpha [Myxococcales bacterium]
MARVPMDEAKVAQCRALAQQIADDVQGYVDRHTTVGVERVTLRALGVTGVDDQGVPLVNLFVDKLHAAGALGLGACAVLGLSVTRHGGDLQDAAERIAFGPELEHLLPKGHGPKSPCPPLSAADHAAALAVLAEPVAAALARIDQARHKKETLRAAYPATAQPGTPLKYVIVATGNIYDDAVQAKGAAHAGADIVAVIRATAQSLLDYVPEGATTEGFGGTFATQENFAIIRRALDEATVRQDRYVRQTNYSSGLCMAEIAWMAAVERLDMLLNDAMYGILFRDINMCRTFVDQYVSRRIIGRAGIVINTGEDNYLTTADAVERAHTVLASQFVNEAFAHRAGLPDELLGLGHAYEIDPSRPDAFLFEVAQAQLVRQVFPRHPIKWMPPTKFKTGDILQAHVHDAMFNLAGVMTHQSIELLGMFSEAIHNPLLMDRYLSLKATRYVFGTAKSLGDEIEWKAGGIVEQRAVQVLDETLAMLTDVANKGIWTAISEGAFADVKRTREGGKGFAGIAAKAEGYANPFLDALER